MRALIPVAILLALALPCPVAAQDVMALVRADRWGEAEAMLAAHPDKVARKLVRWMRLLAPGATGAAEIGAFMRENPDWPQQSTLARRRDEALAMAADEVLVRSECAAARPSATAALLRCGEAMGPGESATALLRTAWVEAPGDPAWEARFLLRWAAVLSTQDHAARLARLSWNDPAAARRQADRVGQGAQHLLDARLALRRDDPTAGALLAGVPAVQRGDPALVLDEARWHRRAGRDDAAVAVWRARGTAAERAAVAERRGAFWDERNLLARRRLRQGDDAGAYVVAAGHAQSGIEQVTDAEFLAGFIALRRLRDPAAAGRHFAALAAASKAAITQGRAQYWLGRAAGDAVTARAAYGRAAYWASTYYGQLAALALGDAPAALTARIAATSDPPADAARALDLSGRELARGAALLVAWGQPRRAQQFLLRLDEVAPDPADRGLVARLATGLGMTDTAIAIARRAGRDGVMLLEAGWPAPEVPREAGVEAALTLAVIRQESNFDPGAVSPAGARGLMQLMPATAASVAKGLGVTAPLAALTGDPSLNMRLGTTYLRGLLDRFDTVIPMAAAGYNAGPGRVAEWIGTNGDPRAGAVDIIDWIELIPFSETRNYVQRVIENTVIYRAKSGGTGQEGARAHPLAAWLR